MGHKEKGQQNQLSHHSQWHETGVKVMTGCDKHSECFSCLLEKIVLLRERHDKVHGSLPSI